MKQLDARGLRAMLDAAAADAPPPLLLDVREPWEVDYASIRVDGVATVAMPMGTVPARVGELDPLQPVVCICHHGMRSAQVVAWLEGRGFEAVYNLAGGIDGWSVDVDPAVRRY